MLYTLPLIADQASSNLLCVFNTDGGIRNNESTPFKGGKIRVMVCDTVRTRRSFPDDLRFAQSRGLCPGASATLRLFLLDALLGGRVVAGTAREDEFETVNEVVPG